MPKLRRALAVCVLAALLTPRPAAADELPVDTGATTSLLVGAGIAVLSVGTGLTITGNAKNGNTKNAGILIAQSGLAVAPFAAHAVQGEWARGAVFAIPSLAAEGGMLGLVEYWGPKLVTGSSLKSQYIYSGLFTLSLLSAGVGIVDSLFAGDRRAARAARLTPYFDRTGGGLSLSGSL